MANCLQIISSGLLISDMSVDTSVSGCSCQVLSISKWNMLSVRRLVAFCESKIDDINGALGMVSCSNQKVVWLDISMNDPLFVHNLDSLDHLDRDVKNSANIKLPSAFLEKIFKRLAKHVHHHNVIHLSIFSFLVANKVKIWNRCFAPQLVD